MKRVYVWRTSTWTCWCHGRGCAVWQAVPMSLLLSQQQQQQLYHHLHHCIVSCDNSEHIPHVTARGIDFPPNLVRSHSSHSLSLLPCLTCPKIQLWSLGNWWQNVRIQPGKCLQNLLGSTNGLNVRREKWSGPHSRSGWQSMHPVMLPSPLDYTDCWHCPHSMQCTAESM